MRRYLEIGILVAAAAAGAEFGLGLAWAFVLGGICLVLLVEMSSRFGEVTQQTVVTALRSRFGFNFAAVPLAALLLVCLMVLGMELTGCAVALELGTGIAFRAWGALAAFGVWLVLWTARFKLLEYVVAILGLTSLVFLGVALWLGPPWRELGAGFVPHVPELSAGRYGFLAAVILGASISPFLFYFYEGRNKRLALGAIGFGTVISVATLVVAALVLPKGVKIESYEQLPALLEAPLGRWGFRAFVAALGIACYGAAAETALVAAHLVAQALGWNFGKTERPRKNARFALVYTVAIVVASIVVLAGVNPIDLTLVAMALSAITLPVAVFPFLLLMNDEKFLGEKKNRLGGNLVVTAIVALAVVLSIVTIPLEIRGG
jgi:Mn2+/Fe2+ NRAMP family transporter